MINRIVIVGLGSAGTRHLRLARLFFPNSEIKVFRHLTLRDIPEFSNGCFSTIDEVKQFAPQVAVIANPSTFHTQIAYELALARVNLLIEKPISSSIEGVVELIKKCEENNLVLMVGYNLRFSKSLNFFRESLLEGNIGQIQSIRCEVGQYLPSWRPESDYRQGVSARKELGGGALLELSHEIDYLRWIFGEVDWVRATLSQQSRLEIDVEDTVHLTLGFVSTNNEKQLVGTLNLDLIRHDRTRTCTAIGEKGTLRWNGLTGDVDLFEIGSSDWKKLYGHEPQRDETYAAEWKDLVEAIELRNDPSITGDDGLRALEIIEAARISAATGTQETISHIDLANRSPG